MQLPALTPNRLIHEMNIVNLDETLVNKNEHEIRKKIKVCTKLQGNRMGKMDIRVFKSTA